MSSPVAEGKESSGVTIGNVEGSIHASIIAGGNVTIGSAAPLEKLQGPPSGPKPVDDYDPAAIRRLLLAAFTPETSRRFCLDRITFRHFVDDFSPNHGLSGNCSIKWGKPPERLGESHACQFGKDE